MGCHDRNSSAGERPQAHGPGPILVRPYGEDREIGLERSGERRRSEERDRRGGERGARLRPARRPGGGREPEPDEGGHGTLQHEDVEVVGETVAGHAVGRDPDRDEHERSDGAHRRAPPERSWGDVDHCGAALIDRHGRRADHQAEGRAVEGPELGGRRRT